MAGYQHLQPSDPEEQRLRADWYAAKTARDNQELYADARFARADRKLTDFIWARNESITKADRAKHPKAKRNQPVPSGGPSGGRALP